MILLLRGNLEFLEDRVDVLWSNFNCVFLFSNFYGGLVVREGWKGDMRFRRIVVRERNVRRIGNL